MQDRSPYARRASAPSGSRRAAPSDFSRRPPSASARRSPASASRRTPSSSASARRSPSAAVRRTPSGTGRRPPAAARGNPPSGGAPRRPAGPQRPRKQRRFRLRLRPIPLLVLAAVLCLGIYAIRFATVLGVGEPRFIDNLSIGGVSIAGYTYEEAEQLAAELEETWRNEAYTLSYQDARWTFTRAMVDADADYETQLRYAWNLGHTGNIFERKQTIEYYDAHPYDFALNVTYDEAKLDAFIDEICAALDKDAVDAVVVPDVGGPVVLTQAEVGLKVNRDQLKEQMVALIEGGEADTAIPAEAVMPAVNTDDASFQVIAEFSTETDFRGSASLHNIRLALNAYNGMVVMPGQRVSFNEVVGPRTQAAGFREGTEYAGDTTTTGWGGGICQASTTLYNALVIADMHIVERNPHSMTVQYVDPSCDAAVVDGGKDLIFENDSDSPIYIYTSVDDEHATVTIYGKRPDYRYELVSVIVEENVPSTRKVYIDDTEGEHAYYTDETALHSKGKPGCVSQGWVVAYDWDTGEEVSRTQVSSDHYSPGASTYWRGVHSRMDYQVGTNPNY